MVAPFASEAVEIKAEPLVSAAFVDMTIDVMNAFSVTVDREGPGHYRVQPGQLYRPRTFAVEPDAMSASYFFAAAAVTGGRVKVDGLTPASSQGDVRFVELLERMGCSVERATHSLTVKGSRYLHGVDVDLNSMPDMALTLAVVACFAQGPTRIRNIAHLEHKESNRLRGTAQRADAARRHRHRLRQRSRHQSARPGSTGADSHVRRSPHGDELRGRGTPGPGNRDRRPRLRGQDVPGLLRPPR